MCTWAECIFIHGCLNKTLKTMQVGNYCISFILCLYSIIGFLTFLHHILVWSIWNIKVVYVKRIIYFGQFDTGLWPQRNRNYIYDLDIFFHFICKTIFAKCISKTDEACNKKKGYASRTFVVCCKIINIYLYSN